MSMHRTMAACLAMTLVVSLAARADGQGLKFEDKMQELGLADPGFAWHGYHDAIVCADFDGDGDVDILVITSLQEESPKGKQGRLYVNKLAETGKLAFVDETEQRFPGGISKSIIADSAPFFWDIDNDGDLDLCSISDEHPGMTFINDKGVFHLEKYGFSAQHCIFRDVNNDGLLDVIGTDTGNVYIAKGDGKFNAGKLEGELSGHMPRNKILPTPPGITVDEQAKAKAATTQPAPAHVYYGWHKMDINGDGVEDYMLSLSMAYGFKTSRFYVKTDQGYKDVTAETGLPITTQLQFIDVDGDGHLDAVSSGEKDAGVFLGDGKGHFTKVDDPETAKIFSIVTGGCYTSSQSLADFDCDGKLDILTVQPRIGTGGAVLAGLSGGKYQKVLAVGASSGQAVADLDNDGLLDIVASSPQRTKGLHIWLNRTSRSGNWLKLQLAGYKQNTLATGAVIEAFAAGADPQTAKPLARGEMDSDALPVHLGLGAADKVDLRVSLGGKVVREMKGVAARQLLKVNLEEAR